MQIIDTIFSEVKIIQPDLFSDNRGWFLETYNEQEYKKIGINDVFVQDNMSLSRDKGILRGLHFQNNPMSQAKIVRCINGACVDICVDLRKNSPTYLKWCSIDINDTNKRQIYIPQGFAHGFVTLTDNVIFEYKVNNLFSKEFDRAIRYDDPEINIDWDSILNGAKPIMSDKDLNAPLLKDSDCNFTYNGEK